MSTPNPQDATRSSFFPIIVKWVGIPVLAVLVFFMAKSKSLYEDLFSSWIDECRILILVSEPTYDETNSESNYFTVDTEIFTYGNPPNTLNLHFATSLPVMAEVTLLEPSRNKSLLEHRWSEKHCPPEDADGFCESLSGQNDELQEDIRISLTPFNKHYQPTFRTTLQRGDYDAELNVFVKDSLADESAMKCKVEKASWVNSWIWAPPFVRLIMLVLFFIIIGTLVEAIRHYLKGDGK